MSYLHCKFCPEEKSQALPLNGQPFNLCQVGDPIFMGSVYENKTGASPVSNMKSNTEGDRQANCEAICKQAIAADTKYG